MITIIQKDNIIDINGLVYQVGNSIAASNPSGDLVQITKSGGYVQFKASYDIYRDESNSTFGATAGQVVTALNSIFSNSNPAGLIKSTDTIRSLDGVAQFTKEDSGKILIVGGVKDGSIAVSNYTTNEFYKYGDDINAENVSATTISTVGVGSGITVGTGGTISSVGSITTSSFLRADSLYLEGATDDSYETHLVAEDPTQDNTITFPNTSGTVALTTDIPDVSSYVDTTGTVMTNSIPVFTDSNTIQGTANLMIVGGTTLATSYNILAAGTLTVANISLGSTTTPTPAISVSALSEDLEIISRGNVDIILDSDTNESGQKFSVNDPSTTERFSVSDLGVVRINDAYSFPTAVPNPGDILIAGASGNTAWREPVFSTISKTGNFTLAATDCQQMIMCNSGAGFTIQIPTGLTKDAEVLVYQEGAGSITITAGSGVTLRNTSGFLNITAEQYAIVGLKHLGTSDVWVVTGERKPV